MRKMEYEELEQILNERKDNEKLELRDLEFDDMDLSDRDLHNIDFEVCMFCDVRRQERLLHTKNVYMTGLCNCWFRRTPNALHLRIRPAGVIRRKCLRSKALMKQKNLMKRGLW